MQKYRFLTRLRRTAMSLMTVGLVVVIVACSSIDCPLNNTVYTNYKVMKTETQPDTLKDTLTIWTSRPGMTDSIIVNRNLNTTALKLPISYMNDKDVLFFQFKTQDGGVCVDTVTVSKTNTPHFESVDCSPNYFHEITGIMSTHNRIDSIVIMNKTVNYDAKDNFYIYFKRNN